MNKYFDIKDKVYDITEKYPETLDVFATHGFEQLKNEQMRKIMGKTISMEMACKSKRINVDLFEQKLIEAIEASRQSEDSSLLVSQKAEGKAEIHIEGVLPCPVRIPLLEGFQEWLEENEKDFPYQLEYELKSANIGVDWIREKLGQWSEDDLPDIFMSAGFDLFFDKKLMGQHIEAGVFKDISGLDKLNKDLDNDYIDLKDPQGRYTVLGVVPAVFLVNQEQLKGREIPRTWADLLKPEFENSVSLPLHDYDLFNAMILAIYKEYGAEGIRKLGRCHMRTMAPAEMVKSHRNKDQAQIPTVTVMPYLFTQMVREDSPLKPVWPEDGAIISPIFLLSKKSSQDKIKPLIDFFFSQEVGALLSDKGGFPSGHPQVDNKLGTSQKFLWPGWDFINSQDDIGGLIDKSIKDFHQAREEL